MARVRIIKKYPNRRLYDTEISSYVTLEDIRQLVQDGDAFVVQDAKTQQDLTRSVLLQIITEREEQGQPLLTTQLLSQLIRFYGDSLQGFMGSYLEKNVQMFTDMQTRLSEQSQGMTPEMWSQFMGTQSPMVQGLMGNYAEQSRTMFMQMQEQMQKQTEQMMGVLGLKR